MNKLPERQLPCFLLIFGGQGLSTKGRLASASFGVAVWQFCCLLSSASSSPSPYTQGKHLAGRGPRLEVTHSCSSTEPLRRQLVQQRPRVLQITRIEPFRKPPVYRSQAVRALAAACPGRARGVRRSFLALWKLKLLDKLLVFADNALRVCSATPGVKRYKVGFLSYRAKPFRRLRPDRRLNELGTPLGPLASSECSGRLTKTFWAIASTVGCPGPHKTRDSYTHAD